MNILGIWDGHDSGAALLQDGRIVFAINEERLTRRKLEVAFPDGSIAACLHHADLRPEHIDIVAASTSDPAKALGRLWPATKERYYNVRRRKTFPGSLANLTRSLKYRITEWAPGPVSRAASRLVLREHLARRGFRRNALRLVDHHEAHAATAAWGSGFDSCAVLTVDGLGDGASATISSFRDGRLERVALSPARHSAGVMFEHVTHLLNMRELEDEGKVMALADYAAPVDDAENALLALIRVDNGVIRTVLPGHALRPALARVHWRFANEQFAYQAQRALEQVLSCLARDAIRLTGLRRLAIAGGVASNVKATRQVRLRPDVDEVFVFPHMGDGGLPLGAAVAAAAAAAERPRVDMARLDFGPRYDRAAIETALSEAQLPVPPITCLTDAVASELALGRVVMWFQGGMEYGPRALGHRSVLARPDRPELRDRLNLVLKRRVWYQPFCPSLLSSDAARVLEDFDAGRNWAMTMAYSVAASSRSLLSGVTSVDGTCRPHIVADDDSSEFGKVLRAGRTLWGVGALLNTSFNIHGEPLVCSPADALDVFRRSGADALAIGPFFVKRAL